MCVCGKVGGRSSNRKPLTARLMYCHYRESFATTQPLSVQCALLPCAKFSPWSQTQDWQYDARFLQEDNATELPMRSDGCRNDLEIWHSPFLSNAKTKRLVFQNAFKLLNTKICQSNRPTKRSA